MNEILYQENPLLKNHRKRIHTFKRLKHADESGGEEQAGPTDLTIVTELRLKVNLIFT